MALICALLVAINITLIKKLQNYDKCGLMLNASIAGVFASFLACPFDQKSKIFHDFLDAPFGATIGVSILAILSLFLFIFSCQMIDGTFFSILRTTEIIFAYILQAFVDHEMPNSLTILGGIFVILSCIFIAFEDYFVGKIPWTNVRKLL